MVSENLNTMSVDVAWFPDYGHIVAGIFLGGGLDPPHCGQMDKSSANSQETHIIRNLFHGHDM